MLDIIGKRNWFFLFSGLVVVPGLIFILLTPLSGGKAGLQFSVDYTGGTVFEMQFKNKDVTTEQVRVFMVQHDVPDAQVTEDSQNFFTIRTKDSNLLPLATPLPTASATATGSASASASAGASASASVTATASTAPTASPSPTSSASASPSASSSASATSSPSPTPSPSPTVSATPSPSPSASPTPSPSPAPVLGTTTCFPIPSVGKMADIAKAMQADPTLGPISCVRRTTTVGPIISAELIQQAILLILVGSLGILIWIGVRFQSIKFGATALVALLHDIIVVVGIFAILGTFLGVQIDALFVTAMLTVIGFSVHDTIVVFDRIRENKARHAGEPFDAIVNHSILQTFGRSINTSFTVVVTLTALLLFAGSAIQFFVLALLIGIISGTYSSIFNASPLLVVWQLWEDRRKAARLAALRGGRRAHA